MKIAFIYDAVYPFITGGAEKRIYELAKRLVQRGHDVHWYGMGWWWSENSQKDIELEGIKLHGVCKPIDLYKNDRRSIKVPLIFSINLLPNLMKEKYDVVDCQGFPFFSCYTAKIHSLFGKSNLIITLHEVWDNYWYEYLGKAGFFGKFIEKIMVYLSSNLIVVSKKTKKDLKKIKSSEESIIIPNGIDFYHITQIKPFDERYDVIFAGRLIKEKNVDILIRSIHLTMKKIPDLKCLIIGDGPERFRLEKIAQELNITNNVIFKDFVKDYDDLISYMKSSKVFVLPSTREGFGIVVIEANACGIPVIVINHEMNAATDLILNQKNGFISKLSENEISEKIITALDENENMHNDCVEIAKDYDWNLIVDKIEKYYELVNNSV